MNRWRVQATWTMGSDHRSYRPVFVDTEARAAATKAEMEENLWHFSTLVVTVDEVTAEAADAETAATEPAKRTVHLIAKGGVARTACGLRVASVDQFAVPRFFAISEEQCPDCAAAERSS